MTASTQESRRGEYERFNTAWRDQVRSDRALPCSTYLVADVIAAHVNRKAGEAWPSQARIAAKTGLSEGAIKRAIRLLERRGYLKVIPGQGRRSSRYQLLLVERAAEKSPELNASIAAGMGSDRAPQRGQTAPREGSPVTPDLLNHLLKEDGGERDARARATPQFDESVKEDDPANDNAPVRPGGAAGKRAVEGAPDRSPEAKTVRPAGARAKPRNASVSAAAKARAEPDTGDLQLEQIWSVRPWIDVDHAEAWRAYEAATREVDPAAMLAAARTWVEAADAPRYLPSLAKWLSAKGWQKAPPQPIRRERAGQRPPGLQGGGKTRAPEPGSDAEAVVDRITDAWNAWARAKGAIFMRWLSDARASRCVELIDRLGRLYPDKTPDEAFGYLLGACSQSFFVKGAGAGRSSSISCSTRASAPG